MESAIKFVEKVTKALIKQQNFSNYYNKTDKNKEQFAVTDRNTQSKVQLEKVKIRPRLQH